MRALACTLVLLILPASAAAGPTRSFDGYLVQSDAPRLKMPGELTFSRASHTDGTQIFELQEIQPGDQAAAGISLGPLHAESEMVNGHRRMHYHIEGPTLLGGEIGAALSQHRAMLTLHWSSSGD